MNMPERWSTEEVEILRRLLKKLVDEKEYDQARVVAKRLAELTPSDAELWYFYGSVMAKLGDPKAAKEYLAKSLELGGDKFSIARQMCFVCMLRGDLEEAIMWCRRGLDLKPADPFLHHELASLYAHSGEPQKAVELLEMLLRMPSLTPKEEKATKEELGRLYMNMQQFDSALANFREALEEDDPDPAILANIGHCLSRKGESKEALTAFQYAAHLLPEPQNLYNLGDAYLDLEDPKKAISPLLEAVRRDPDYSLAHYDLSLAYFRLGRYKEGAEEARAALKTDPEMRTGRINLGSSATGNLGLCLMNLKKYEEALQCFKRNEKQFASTYFNLGLTLFKMHLHKEALTYFKKALEITPDDPEYLDLLGQTYDTLGNYKAAEKYLRRSLELDPQYAYSYYDLGNLFLKLKDKRKEARRLLERAIELAPDMEQAYYCLACYYALTGKKTKALEYLGKALEKGFRDRDWIEADHDVDSLKGDPRFGKLMGRYFVAESSSSLKSKEEAKGK
jgi:superkiller protein 3